MTEKINFTPSNFNLYEIDFTKVNTLDDVITILKGLEIRVTEQYEKFEELRPLLKKID